MPCPIDLDRRAAAAFVRAHGAPLGGYGPRGARGAVQIANALDTLAAVSSLALLSLAVPVADATAQWLRSLQGEDGAYPSLATGWAALRCLALLQSAPRLSPVAWFHDAERDLEERSKFADPHQLIQDTERLVELGLEAGLLTLVEARVHYDRLWASPNGRLAPEDGDLVPFASLLHLARLVFRPIRRAPLRVALETSAQPNGYFLSSRPISRSLVDEMDAGLMICREINVVPSDPTATARVLSSLQGPDGGIRSRLGGAATLWSTWHGLRAVEALESMTSCAGSLR